MLEVVLASLGSGLFVLTIAWRDWIEAVFGVDPDRSSGATELLVAAALLGLALTAAALARAEWRRAIRSG